MLCRQTDKQSAVVSDEEEDEMSDVALDDILTLDQEPSPEYDVDDEQRPRLSRVSFCWQGCAGTNMHCQG